MLDFAFNNYEVKSIIKEGEKAGNIYFEEIHKRNVPLVYNDNFKMALRTEENVLFKKNFTELSPPIKKGTYAGKVEVYFEGNKIGEVQVVTNKTFKKLSVFERIKLHILNFYDKIIS